jgi:hypothetical protein
MTIFGEVIVSRIAYGGRKITSLKPLDGELNLPWEKYSHGLAEKVSQTVAFNGFDKTEELIKENTGGKIPKRQLEEIAQKSAHDFELFYEAQQKQDTGKETGERMVLTMDGKGVVWLLCMRSCATKKELTVEQRSAVDKCATYLVSNRAYLRYDHYLASGFPLATGVIEGACRHLVKDRMDITGARWSLKGAEAVLRLCSLCVSGDWAKYWQFHLKKECERNHQDLYKGGIPLLQRVSSARCPILNSPKLMMA